MLSAMLQPCILGFAGHVVTAVLKLRTLERQILACPRHAYLPITRIHMQLHMALLD